MWGNARFFAPILRQKRWKRLFYTERCQQTDKHRKGGYI